MSLVGIAERLHGYFSFSSSCASQSHLTVVEAENSFTTQKADCLKRLLDIPSLSFPTCGKGAKR
jgi:hypothetical protein